MLDNIKQSAIVRHPSVQFVIFIIRRFIQDRCTEQASSLTYTTLFAVVPMLTVFLVIISSIKALEPARQQLQDLIYSNLLPKTTIAFDQALNNFAEKSSNLTVIGIAFLFVTTIMMIMSIETAFNRIWRVQRERSGVMSLMRYWTIISLGPLILGSAFALSSALASMDILHNNFGYQLDKGYLLGVLSYLLILVGFFFLYWAVPNRRVPWKSALIAAFFASIIFEALKNLFGWVMSNFTSYELVYGAVAALPIFLLWIYLSWNIILLGVQLSYALTTFHPDNRLKRHPLFAILDILYLFYKKQKNGESVKEEEFLDHLSGRELGNAPIFLDILEKHQFISRTHRSDEYVLIRNMSEISLYEFGQMLRYTYPTQQEINKLSCDTGLCPEPLKPLYDESHQYLQNQFSIKLAELFELQNKNVRN